jgi:hypothetical protein
MAALQANLPRSFATPALLAALQLSPAASTAPLEVPQQPQKQQRHMYPSACAACSASHACAHAAEHPWLLSWCYAVHPLLLEVPQQPQQQQQQRQRHMHPSPHAARLRHAVVLDPRLYCCT